jgi:coenzyme F420-reducing hydrogenase alpha subunit
MSEAIKVRTIKVETLARVEGEGALYVKFKGSKVQDIKLRIYEPPRLFEAFLRDRHYAEVPDITARICGICPIAYQMSAVHALERAMGVEIDPMVRLLRRLFYCGEWIESHALHVYMLHAPDFLGYADVAEMARDHRAAVERALHDSSPIQ